ncbi:MAG: acyl-CoA dehydrogenase family protein [Bdellovibrionales bacterium]|nr:acyl-CoA dehydrogenase family protein [Bdellovibrionales bacterium]
MNEFLLPIDPSELHAFAQSARKFSAPRALLSDPAALAYDRAHFQAMATLGLCGLGLEEHYGGIDVGALGTAAIIFELARADLGPAIYLSVHLMVAKLLSRADSDGRAAELIASLARGEKLAAFALTEPEAGSDAAALRTKATSKDGEYYLSGEKCYITSGGVADLYLVFARSGGNEKADISAFLVPSDTEGLSFGPAEKKMGCIGAPICSLSFDHCRVPQSARLGAEGAGYSLALSGLNGGRINIGAAACGIAARAIEIAASHLKQRTQFGRPLAEFQGLQFMLADMAILLRTAVLAVRDAALAEDRGEHARVAASIAKCVATDAAMKITTDAVQLLGGAGYLQEYIAERLMRDAKMLQIVEGTNQIQRVLIARSLLQE